MMPANSWPGMEGRRDEPSLCVEVGPQVSSSRVMPVALTRMSASPGRSDGTGASSMETGASFLWKRAARMLAGVFIMLKDSAKIVPYRYEANHPNQAGV